MQIKDVCERCHLTKKAVEYYEEKGLVAPRIQENGYREYTEQEVAVLQEIAVLRQCGMGLDAVRAVLAAPQKAAALEKWLYLAEVKRQRDAAVQTCLTHLQQDYDIDWAFRYLRDRGDDLCTLKERLVLAFPGNYGLFLALHFGRFLDEPVDTAEKKAAYQAVIAYLDQVEVQLPPELCTYLEAFTTMTAMEELESQTHQRIADMLADPDAYLERNRADIEAYLAFKASEEYATSPAGRMQALMTAFQQRSGYQDVFLHNLQILSRSYRAYLAELEEANEWFRARFPSWQNSSGACPNG